jgi:hypothetical protein
LSLEVEVRDENGGLVDPAAVFVNPDQALTVNVTNAEGEELSGLLALRRDARPGIFRAQTLDAGLGQYNIRVAATGDLAAGYIYGPNNVETATVNRVIHPLHLPLAGGSIALLVLLVAAAVMISRVRTSRRIHPCTGRLYIVDAAGIPHFQVNLDTIGRNRIEFNSKSAPPINAITHVSRLVVTCDSEDAHKAGQVQVLVYLDNNNVPSTRTLRPNQEMQLGHYYFWLLKDPTDEQLERVRSSGDGAEFFPEPEGNWPWSELSDR